jgi:thiamine biosynthesis lipoprotein
MCAVLAMLLAGGLGCARSADSASDGGTTLLLQRAERKLAGTVFQIEVVSQSKRVGHAALEAAFEGVAAEEQRISTWSETSEISAVNRAAGHAPVAVSHDLFAVMERSVWASELTGGAFDVTFAGCGGVWSVSKRRIPSQQEIDECLPRVDYRRIELYPERSSLFLPRPDMRIDLGGIGKGYRVDQAAAVLRAHGITSYLVNGGGDIRLAGRKIDRPWAVEIAHPREPDGRWGVVQLDRGAVVTSGDYSWYFEQDGVRYHHIIDPTTGQPARRSVAVTVIAQSAMDADALATGLFVMGPERALDLVERLPGVEALIIDPQLTAHVSSGFPAYDVHPFGGS